MGPVHPLTVVIKELTTTKFKTSNPISLASGQITGINIVQWVLVVYYCS